MNPSLKISIADGGFNGIYCDLAGLELTQQLMIGQPVWKIPDMNRELVEGAVHPDRIAALVEEKGEAWERYDRTVGKCRSFLQYQYIDSREAGENPASPVPVHRRIIRTLEKPLLFDQAGALATSSTREAPPPTPMATDPVARQSNGSILWPQYLWRSLHVRPESVPAMTGNGTADGCPRTRPVDDESPIPLCPARVRSIGTTPPAASDPTPRPARSL